GLIARDKPMSNAYAKALVNDLIASDEAEIKARRKLYNSLIKALPPTKAARYMQLEAKARAYQEYDIAPTLPLVKQRRRLKGVLLGMTGTNRVRPPKARG